MYVWWSECGLGFGSDADNFELKNINVHVCGQIGGFVGPRWVYTLLTLSLTLTLTLTESITQKMR